MLWIFPRIIQIPWLFSLKELVTFSPITLLQCLSLSPRHQLNESWVCILTYKYKFISNTIWVMRNVFLSSVLLFHIVNGTGGIWNHESSAYEAAALTTLLQFLIVDTTFHVLLLPMIMIRHWHIRISYL